MLSESESELHRYNAMKKSGNLEVVVIIREYSPWSIRELKTEVGVARSAVSYRLRPLRRAYLHPLSKSITLRAEVEERYGKSPYLGRVLPRRPPKNDSVPHDS